MSRIFRLLSQLLDVDLTSTPPADGDALTYDSGSEKWVPAAGGAGADDQTAAEVPFTPAGTIAATDTQSAVEEVATDAAAAVAALSTVYQPLDSDLTSIAALTTTSFGRGLLELANQAALLSAAGAAAASHVHAGEDITSGTVADARIASTIARDSEVTSAISALSSVYQPLDSDLTSIAALTTTTFGRAFLALADEAAFKAAVNLEAGTDFPSQATFDDHSSRHENGGADEISITGLDGTPTELTNHLNDTSDAHDASAISVLDTATNFAGTDVEAVLAELQDNIDAGGGGAPTDATYIVQTANGSLSAEQALGALSTGMLKNTTTTGVLSIGSEGTDYYKPTGTDVTLADGGTGASLSDPNADRIMFWDDSAGAVTWLTPGTGLTITTTTIAASSPELDYVQYTGDVAISATTPGAADTIVTGNSVAYDGSTAVIIEFFAFQVIPNSTGAIGIVLFEDGSDIGILGFFQPIGASNNGPIYLRRRMTPSNASHTYSFRGYRSVGNGTVKAGAGGAATGMPGFIRITRA